MQDNYFYKKLSSYFDFFNSNDDERYKECIPNSEARDFIFENAPLFDCPEKELELTYYYRWWVFRKHIKKCEAGYIITEFFPEVYWAVKYNAIPMASGYHILEGRWLKNQKILNDYIAFWLDNPDDAVRYTSWLGDSIYQRALLTGDFESLKPLIPKMIDVLNKWDNGFMFYEHYIGKKENGLYRNIDDRDGTEYSIGGHGYRPLLNCSIYAFMNAIAQISRHCGEEKIYQEYKEKSEKLKELYLSKAWNQKLDFFTVIDDDEKQQQVREIWGYAPWYAGMADKKYDIALRQLSDKSGFSAPYGLTSAEQRHPDFAIRYDRVACRWDGPVWPNSTSLALNAVIRTLKQRDCDNPSPEQFYDMLLTYSKSQRLITEDGKIIPWIDENLNPYTGDWIARTIINIHNTEDKGKERGREYNHSMFCDHIISGLVGVTPEDDGSLSIIPLLPSGYWEYFALINIPVQNKNVAIYWDKNGDRYNKGKGMTVFCNDKLIFNSDTLDKIKKIHL